MVAVTSWQGTAKGALTTRELDGKRVGKRFGCKRTSPSGESTVAESEMSWMPLLAGEWKLLERGLKVAAEGQRQWRTILTVGAEGWCDATFLCKGNGKVERVAMDRLVAVKVERLPLHSIEGVGPSLRQHGGQHRPPLFLDDRGGREVVRALYGDEVWNAQGFSPRLLGVLESSGVSTEACGTLAAMEVPQRIAEAVVKAVFTRLRLKLEEAEATESKEALPWLIPDAARGERRRVSLLVIKLGGGPEEQPLVLCCKGQERSWMVGDTIRASQGEGEGCLKRARVWAGRLVIGGAEPFQHSRDVDKDRVDVVCMLSCGGRLRAEQEAGYVWRTLEELGSGCVFMLAANAVGLALTFTSRIGRHLQGDHFGRETGEGARWRGAQEEILFAAQKSGKLAAKLVDSGLSMEGQVGSWGSLLREDAMAREALKAAMARAETGREDGERQALGEWADLITPIDTLDLPEGLADEWQGFGQQRLQTQEFVARCVQTPSDGLPLAAAQETKAADFQPQSTEELFEPWAWVALQSWVKKQLDFLKDIRKRGTDAVRQSNETLALGSEALVPAARGIWWDCRGTKPTPLDLEHVEGSHINFELLVEDARLWNKVT